MGKLDDSEYGQVEFVNGELMLDAHVNDPVAFRGSKKAGNVGPGSSAIVFFGVDIKRSDNKKECVGFIAGRIDDRYPVGHEGTEAAGEWEFFIRKPKSGSVDAAMVRQMRIRWDGIEVWDHAAGAYRPLLGLTGPPSPDQPTTPPPVVRPPDGPLTLAPGTLLLLPGGATVVTGSGPVAPPVVQPPTPPAEPPPTQHKHVAVFVHGGREHHVEAGDFDYLASAACFGFRLDKSDYEDYERNARDRGEAYAMDELIALYKRKDSSNS
jgi:hypothetical protein